MQSSYSRRIRRQGGLLELPFSFFPGDFATEGKGEKKAELFFKGELLFIKGGKNFSCLNSMQEMCIFWKMVDKMTWTHLYCLSHIRCDVIALCTDVNSIVPCDAKMKCQNLYTHLVNCLQDINYCCTFYCTFYDSQKLQVCNLAEKFQTFLFELLPCHQAHKSRKI